MALIRYDKLVSMLDTAREKEGVPRLLLFFGDSYLVRQAFHQLTQGLTQAFDRRFDLEALDGPTTSMGDLIEHVTTFSFFSSGKMVVVKQAPLFPLSSKEEGQGYSPTDLDHLTALIEKAGIPDRHFLVFMTGEADKRRRIFRTLDENGWVIDCSVSRGTRKADTDEQAGVLRQTAARILEKAGKTMSGQAFQLLWELTGIDLELFSGNLDKLIAYSGDRKEILPRDVQAVVSRDRKDPIFMLSNALMDKNLPRTLCFLEAMLKEGAHPLQILKLLENQIRKLLLVKCAVASIQAKNRPGHLKSLNFNQFRQTVLPEITRQDQWITQHFVSAPNPSSGKRATGKSSAAGDLLLVSNPQNAYPLWQIFQKSGNFSSGDLQQAMMCLSDLELRLKSSALDAKTAFDAFIITICSKGDCVYAPENQNRCHDFQS